MPAECGDRISTKRVERRTPSPLVLHHVGHLVEVDAEMRGVVTDEAHRRAYRYARQLHTRPELSSRSGVRLRLRTAGSTPPTPSRWRRSSRVAYIGEDPEPSTTDHTLIFGDPSDRGMAVHGTLDELRAFTTRLAQLTGQLREYAAQLIDSVSGSHPGPRTWALTKIRHRGRINREQMIK